MRWAPDINNTLSTNQMSNAFQNNFSAQIFCENIWRSFNIESFLSRTANIAKRVCVSKVNVVSLKYLKVSSFYRTDCYIHQKAEAQVVKQITKIARIAKAALHKLPGKSLPLSCLSCLSGLSWCPVSPVCPVSLVHEHDWHDQNDHRDHQVRHDNHNHQDSHDHDDHITKLDVVRKQIRVCVISYNL